MNNITINLTESQVENLKDFFEIHLISGIRDDPELDNIEWLVDMVKIYEQLKEIK